MTYSETLEYLFTAMPSFQNIGGDAYKPGLERITSFCEILGSPHLKYKVIHIAGTNGKGSTSHMLASVAQHSGYRTALFTSPHLRDFRERMRVDGEMISEEEVVEFVAQHRDVMERLQLSFFEMTAAMAFDFFARKGVDVAVIETGLGGRLDATNIVEPILSIITNIGIDHTKFLGTTLASIATEKGGIVKANVPIVLGERGEEYTDVISDIACAKGSKLIFAEDSWSVEDQKIYSVAQSITLQKIDECTKVDLRLDLSGSYQAKNLVTAHTAIDWLAQNSLFNISEESVSEGLSSVISTTKLLGRWQTLCSSPRIICDTGHNAHGLKYVMEQLRITPRARLIMVLGFANDKRLDEILPLFNIEDAHFIFTRPKVDRAFDCEKIAEVARRLGYDCETVANVSDAVKRAKDIATCDDLIFVGGSNFVVAEVI
ncbi:MAG: folylpolyglutamate synthase/dihydrofolate synthase family protein [Rikenellaceae bacterium]